MSVRPGRWLVVVSLTVLAVATVLLPAAAQELPGGGGGVSCDPADPDPGGETTCTAEGLQPGSVYDWVAEFADGSTREGGGVADDEGVGGFTVTVPDGEEARGDYTVTVTGTGSDGEPYEESHQGTVGGGGPLDALLPPGDGEPTEGEPTEEPSEEPAPGGDDGDTAPAPDGAEGQVDPVPTGAVAAGLGGTAEDLRRGPLTLLAVVLLLAAVAGQVTARRHLAAGSAGRR